MSPVAGSALEARHDGHDATGQHGEQPGRIDAQHGRVAMHVIGDDACLRTRKAPGADPAATQMQRHQRRTHAFAAGQQSINIAILRRKPALLCHAHKSD